MLEQTPNTTRQPENPREEKVASRRADVEGFLGGAPLNSGINSAHALATALWVRCSELGISYSNTSTSLEARSSLEVIPDLDVYVGGRVLTLSSLTYDPDSGQGASSGNISIQNHMGSCLKVPFINGAVSRVSIDDLRVNGGDSIAVITTFCGVLNSLTKQILSATRSDFAVGIDERVLKKLEFF